MVCKSIVGTLRCQIFRPCSVQEVNRNRTICILLSLRNHKHSRSSLLTDTRRYFVLALRP